jgi:hypothetical protein
LRTRTPAVLDALLRGLPPEWTRVNEGPDTWSAYDVIGHLIHGERTDWMVRAHIVQISRVTAKQLTDDVGPWVEYLRVLR